MIPKPQTYRNKKNFLSYTSPFCEVCGRPGRLDLFGLHRHHIVPRSRGGSDYHSNLIVLCNGCHEEAHQNEFTEQELKDMKGRLSKFE